MTSQSTSVHRLLDEAFSGLPMTPDTQDLKEEIRANLVARVAELQADGLTGEEAARRAVDELGDVRSLVESEGTGAATQDRRPAQSAGADVAAEIARNRVRPRPAFVLGTVVAAFVLAGSVATVLLSAGLASVRDAGPWFALAVAAVAAVALGWIVSSSLAQETSRNFPMPRRRAVLFGTGWAIVLFGALLAYVRIVFDDAAWALAELGAVGSGVVVVALVVAGVLVLVHSVATSTNRRKPWVLRLEAEHLDLGNRFERDPAAAARFGIYTAVTWTLTGVTAVVVGSTVGWQWVWLPGVAGWVVFMLMLATMLFGRGAQGQNAERG